MKLFIVALFCVCSSLALGQGAPAEKGKRPSAAHVATYGEYPMGYQLIIRNFLRERLLDPDSAQISYDSEPRPVKHAIKGKRPLVGYSVSFRVNSRNRFGMYTGDQAYHVIIRNGDVIHVERGRAPGKRR
jgi:hypothetical protein